MIYFCLHQFPASNFHISVATAASSNVWVGFFTHTRSWNPKSHFFSRKRFLHCHHSLPCKASAFHPFSSPVRVSLKRRKRKRNPFFYVTSDLKRTPDARTGNNTSSLARMWWWTWGLCAEALDPPGRVGELPERCWSCHLGESVHVSSGRSVRFQNRPGPFWEKSWKPGSLWPSV